MHLRKAYSFFPSLFHTLENLGISLLMPISDSYCTYTQICYGYIDPLLVHVCYRRLKVLTVLWLMIVSLRCWLTGSNAPPLPPPGQS